MISKRFTDILAMGTTRRVRETNLLPFEIDQSVSKSEIESEFKCILNRGICYSATTQTIVLIANHNVDLFNDRHSYEEDVFLYTGEGKTGEQKMTYGNKRLNEARFDGTPVHLFERFYGDSYYTYRGLVGVGNPYREKQPDINGNNRFVFIFPLTLLK